mgnify:CR=1 FL=1
MEFLVYSLMVLGNGAKDRIKIKNMNIQKNKEYFIYLFDLQKSGRTNMFGAGALLQREMDLNKNKAREILIFWMEKYDEIAKELDVEV